MKIDPKNTAWWYTCNDFEAMKMAGHGLVCQCRDMCGIYVPSYGFHRRNYEVEKKTNSFCKRVGGSFFFNCFNSDWGGRID